jgi:hypothetical protein
MVSRGRWGRTQKRPMSGEAGGLRYLIDGLKSDPPRPGGQSADAEPDAMKPTVTSSPPPGAGWASSVAP